MRQSSKSTFYVRCREQNKVTLYAMTGDRTCQWTKEFDECLQYETEPVPFPGEWVERCETKWQLETFKVKNYRKWD